MKKEHKPVALKNAPLEYAPSNELGVVFLFANVARRLQFRIEEIRPQFPDCIAYRRIGDSEKRTRIEFEFRSSNFKAHRHAVRKCDVIVCWHHDWPDAPSSLEIIELKRYFGVARKVWILQALKGQWEYLDDHNCMDWGMSKRTTPGDVLLMYRCSPVRAITDVFTFSGDGLARNSAGWRDGEAYFGQIKRVCRLRSPVFLDDLRKHRVLKTASFVRRNMQGVGLLATEYWSYLYEMILERNPAMEKPLRNVRPERL
ncbi:MAG: hypothetical protein JXR96_18585 [Deltaproteobacteria bacterium]|nr:hypothetical protein [Deltaproteobacteria bacterium]